MGSYRRKTDGGTTGASCAVPTQNQGGTASSERLVLSTAHLLANASGYTADVSAHPRNSRTSSSESTGSLASQASSTSTFGSTPTPAPPTVPSTPPPRQPAASAKKTSRSLLPFRGGKGKEPGKKEEERMAQAPAEHRSQPMRILAPVETDLVAQVDRFGRALEPTEEIEAYKVTVQTLGYGTPRPTIASEMFRCPSYATLR